MESKVIRDTEIKMSDLFNGMMKGNINYVKIKNDGAIDFLQYILNKGQLSHFRITINYKRGETLFNKR